MLIKKSTFLTLLAAVTFTSDTTLAVEAVKVPATAKLLTKAEIVATYGGTTSNWEHPNTDGSHGTAIVNADATKGHGTYADDKSNGTWESKITFKGDQYCWSVRVNGKGKFQKPVCNLIYLDGKVAYEVDPKSKKILSVNTIQ
jgi:hypothetical protein